MGAQRVLVVDDDPSLCAVMTRELKPLFEVVATSRPEDAITLLRGEQPFAAVVSDYTMEPVDGLRVLDVARDRKPGAARVLVTGLDREEDVGRAHEEGLIHRVVAKPWPAARLGAIVLAAIDALAPG
jgi:CheY-like chemotaxis protein